MGTFKLSSSYELRVLEDTKTVSQSSYHDHFFVYIDALKDGLRFPLHPFIMDFFNSSNLTITQFSSNSWAILSAFVILCRLLEIEPLKGAFVPFMLGSIVASSTIPPLHGRRVS